MNKMFNVLDHIVSNNTNVREEDVLPIERVSNNTSIFKKDYCQAIFDAFPTAKPLSLSFIHSTKVFKWFKYMKLPRFVALNPFAHSNTLRIEDNNTTRILGQVVQCDIKTPKFYTFWCCMLGVNACIIILALLLHCYEIFFALAGNVIVVTEVEGLISDVDRFRGLHIPLKFKSGFIPTNMRSLMKTALQSKLFEEGIFVVFEADESTYVFDKAVTLLYHNPDPLIVGMSRGCAYLLGQFDMTPAEHQISREFTE